MIFLTNLIFFVQNILFLRIRLTNLSFFDKIVHGRISACIQGVVSTLCD